MIYPPQVIEITESFTTDSGVAQFALFEAGVQASIGNNGKIGLLSKRAGFAVSVELNADEARHFASILIALADQAAARQA